MKTQLADFERFTLEIPEQAIPDCSHQGACDEDVEHWQSKIDRPDQCTVDALTEELREYGAWEDEELRDDDANWRRIVWIAACNLKEERQSR